MRIKKSVFVRNRPVTTYFGIDLDVGLNARVGRFPNESVRVQQERFFFFINFFQSLFLFGRSNGSGKQSFARPESAWIEKKKTNKGNIHKRQITYEDAIQFLTVKVPDFLIKLKAMLNNLRQ